MTKKNFHLWKIFALFVLGLILNSCGLWQDFTVYFNTYYNASTIFSQTEDDIKSKITDPFDFRTIPVTSQQKTDLTKVIEKCSKILQFDKESAYFQDALFIIGKAFYYQEEYAKSQRKFLELYNVKNSNYRLESQLWLAKTQLKLRSFDEGLALLDSTIAAAQKEDREKIFVDGSITRIAFLFYREKYSEAAERAKEFLKVSEDDEINALVAYQLGVIYEKLGETDQAAQIFATVENYSPTFEVEFKSRFEYAQLLNKLNKRDESLQELEKLRYENKFVNYLDQINLKIGELYYDEKNVEKSLQTLTLVDSTYGKTESGGRASFDIGKIYEFYIANYDSARKYYTKTVSSLAPKEIKDSASAKVTVFNKYFSYRNKINDNLEQLKYLNDPVAFERDSIDFHLTTERLLELYDSEQQNQRTTEQDRTALENVSEASLKLAENQKIQTAVQWAQAKLKTGDNPELRKLIEQGRLKRPERPTITADSLDFILSGNYYEIGNIFFNDLDVPDSAAYYYDKVLNTPNNKSIIDRTYYALGTYYETRNDTVMADSMYSVIFNNYKDSPLHSDVAIKLGKVKVESSADPAEKLFLAAESKYFEKSYEEAIKEFNDIYDNYPKSAFAPKSLYAIGMIYEDYIENNDSAATIYEKLVKDYPVTDYAKNVQGKLDVYEQLKKQEEDKKAQALDSLKALANGKLMADTTANKNGKMNKNLPKTFKTKPDSAGIEQGKNKIALDTNKIKPDTGMVKLDTIKTNLDSNRVKLDTNKATAPADTSKTSLINGKNKKLQPEKKMPPK